VPQTFAARCCNSIIFVDDPNTTSSGGRKSIGSVRLLVLRFGTGILTRRRSLHLKCTLRATERSRIKTTTDSLFLR
jgi:hypothetical protein